MASQVFAYARFPKISKTCEAERKIFRCAIYNHKSTETEAVCGLGARSHRLREPRRSSGQLLAAAIGHQKGGNAGRRRGKHEIEGRREGKSGGSDERGGDRRRGAAGDAEAEIERPRIAAHSTKRGRRWFQEPQHQ